MKRALLLCLVALSAFADEGMWLFNNFPSAKVKAKYGFEPTQAWLDHLRLSSVRAPGCSASVVSPNGLVMTNHHCARSCLQSQSELMKKDLHRDGFFAKTEADEVKCPGYELNQLTEITDVTKRIQDATKTVPAAKFADTQRETISAIEKECASSDELRCEVVTLYRGGKYDLYKYRRLSDIRLVMAPEDRIAFFGGDPENFTFPRYNLDVSFVRIYGADGKPAHMEHSLTWSTENVKEGDLTFVSGSPGRTSRLLTVAQLEDELDYQLPESIARLAELRGTLTEYMNRGVEQRRHANDVLFSIENRFKVAKGNQSALADAAFFGSLVAAENDFRKKINAKPGLQKQYGKVWSEIAKIVVHERELRTEYEAIEGLSGGDLLRSAKSMVRYGDESVKPNADRFREYSDARLPQLRSRLFSNAPIIDELEITRLTFALSKLREDLGADHPVVRKLLGAKMPSEVAAAAVKSTKLKELAYRKELYEGGKAKIDASKDPMLELIRAYDTEARALRARHEAEVEGPLKQQHELLAKARFELYGTTVPPDATFSLRISYGTMKGYRQASGKVVAPFTTIGGAFDHQTGADPYVLPKTWLDAKSKLALDTPFNIVTTNDIIGGNSGSPVVNKNGEVVGLAFDGNIESLGGDYGFDEAVNRSIVVHSAAIIESLEKIYGAKRLVDEMKAGHP